MEKLKHLNKFIEGKHSYYLLIFLFVFNLMFGFLYLISLIEKVKLTDYKNQLVRQNNQINADISRIKLEIDEKVDLTNVEKISREKLKMTDIKEVKYIKVE